MEVSPKNFITINSKSYPMQDDGGTCFTTFEIAKAANLYGFSSIVLIPQIYSKQKVLNFSQIEFIETGYSSFFQKIKNIFLNKNNTVYYNCAFNLHVLVALVAIINLRILNKEIKAKILFSGHGSFANSLQTKFYKNLWIKFIIKPFILFSKAEYIANSLGELEDLCKDLTNLHGITYRVADNKFPSFIFTKEIDINNKSQRDFQENRFNKYILYLGRIVPKKQLIEAIEFLKKNDWFKGEKKFIIAHANDNDEYLKMVQKKIKEMCLSEKVIFVGKVNGFTKWNLILNSSAFILLSESEGMPISLLEADTLGLPIICTSKCNYLPNSKNSIIVDNINNNFINEIKIIMKDRPDAFMRAKEIDYKKLHISSGFYSSFKEIFDEKY